MERRFSGLTDSLMEFARGGDSVDIRSFTGDEVNHSQAVLAIIARQEGRNSRLAGLVRESLVLHKRELLSSRRVY